MEERSVHIHPTAIIDPSAILGADITVGPYAVIGANVEIANGVQIGAGAKIGAFVPKGETSKITIGEGTIIYPDVQIMGHASIGKNNKIYAAAQIGTPAFDTRYKGEPTCVSIGDDNVIGAMTRIQRGTMQGASQSTTIGNKNMIMANCSIGHDDSLGNAVNVMDDSRLAGHVHIGDNAVVSANTSVHQWVHIGRRAMIMPHSLVGRDVLPYCMAGGGTDIEHHGAWHEGINKLGVERGDGDPSVALRAFKAVFTPGFAGAVKRLRTSEFETNPYAQEMADFIEASLKQGRRGISTSANALKRRTGYSIGGDN